MRNPIERIVRSITPENCVGCDVVGSILCTECLSTLSYPDRCFGCKKSSHAGLTCATCKKKTPVDAQCVVTGLEGLGKKLVYVTKYGASREGADFMGEAIAKRLPFLGADTYIVPVPTTGSRQRQRGFDQAIRIAQSTARAAHLRTHLLLKRSTKTHQIGATRKERIDHMKDAFIVPSSVDLRGMTIVLVDDVATTGATIESAAKIVRMHGASRVIAALFARAD